jgi:hypothetical protein
MVARVHFSSARIRGGKPQGAGFKVAGYFSVA